MSQNLYFVSCPKGIEYLLADELVALGLEIDRQAPAGVWARGSLEAGYRACLWSRLANRVILQLADSSAATADDLYHSAYAIDWQEHLAPTGTFKVVFSGENREIRNTQFGAHKVKDAIVDRLRTAEGLRPSVTSSQPDVAISARLHRDRVFLGVDLSGDSLHKRGYRTEKGEAPLRENLAAALLIRGRWSYISKSCGTFLDPMCGSGTLLIEAAWMATDRAPGLDRSYWGFEGWQGHVPALWSRLCDEARDRNAEAEKSVRIDLRGFDANPNVIGTAERNIQRAGVQGFCQVGVQTLTRFSADSEFLGSGGLMLTNPPYGERLSDRAGLGDIYGQLGQLARQHLTGWQMGIFTAVPEFCRMLGLRSHKQYKLFNGPLAAQLLLFDIRPEGVMTPHHPDSPKPLHKRVANPERAQMFANRLRKNRKAIGGWARKQGIECYRLYDADMPEFSLAVDLYGDYVHVQEYTAPKSVDEKAAEERLQEAMAVLPEALDVPEDRIVLKQRARQKGKDQYEKQAASGEYFEVGEAGCVMRVNLRDYLDTGLFLDHRPVRRRIQSLAGGRSFLNLFCYTGAATVHAVVGGARESLSLDMSRTYTEWARANIARNGGDARRHRVEQVDCLKWLDAEPTRGDEYDLIFLDPPTFSNSSKMSQVLDIQRDHSHLIDRAMARLAKDGLLIFSNNYRGFKMDTEVDSRYSIQDISRQTLDKDFERNPRIHHCWEIRWKS